MEKFNQLLISRGFKIDDKSESFVGHKGAQRYINIVDVLQKYLPDDKKIYESSSIDSFYIFDIFMRREYQRLIKPMDIHIRTKISNYFFTLTNDLKLAPDMLIDNSTQDGLLGTKDNLDDIKVSTKKRDRRRNGVKGAIDDRKSYLKKHGKKTFYQYIDEMTMGQLVRFVRAMSDESYKAIFKGFKVAKDRGEFIKDIDFLRILRNSVMHHNILQRTKGIVHLSPSDILDNFLRILVKEGKYGKAYISLKKRIKNEFKTGEDKKEEFKRYSPLIKKLYDFTAITKKYNNIHKK